MTANAASMAPHQETMTRATIRFAGDSGDGMQLTGTQFTQNSALAGHDLATLPDFPAEIRAPAGTLPGVSAFQLQFAAEKIFTPGDTPDVLVAMNAAALKKNIGFLKDGGTLLVNTNGFEKGDLKKAGYDVSPLEDGSLDGYATHKVAITDLTLKALDDSPLSSADKKRCKNLYALGILFWLFDRDPKSTQDWIKTKFGKKPDICEANLTALKAGQIYGDVSELFQNQYILESASLPAGKYRNITGNHALSIGLVAASHKAKKQLFLGSYPITPASDILHSLSKLRNYNVVTFQAEDEIAAVCSAIGASYAGNIGLTTTSGPGLALKGEAIGLAVMTELPLVVVNVQRGGPSTGLPTKTEQSDLLQSMYGRNGECPVPIIAPQSPGDAFWAGFEAVRIATKYMIPVLILSDGYIANGAEPWLIPDVESLPEVNITNHAPEDDFLPYKRAEDTMARPWAIPGTPKLEHRIGGIEKEALTGNVSYDPENHHQQCVARGEKVLRIQEEFGPTEVNGADSGDLLVISWGSTYGAVWEGVRRCQENDQSVSHLHLRWINPLPSDLGDVLKRFKKVLIPEINLGQLIKIIRAEYLVDAIGFNLIRGLPFKASEIEAEIQKHL